MNNLNDYDIYAALAAATEKQKELMQLKERLKKANATIDILQEQLRVAHERLDHIRSLARG